MKRARWRHLVLVLGAWVIWLACAGSQSERRWYRDVSAADRLVDEEQYEAALASYERLLQRAPSGSERRYITYRMGLVEERRGNYEAAIDTYLSLLDHHEIYDPIEDHTPRALFRVGLILYDRLGRQEEGLKIWRDVVHYFPDAEGPAHRALDGILVHFEQNRMHEEAVRYFATEFRALQDTRMGDNMLYWLAYWYRHHLDLPDRALELFLEVRARYLDTSSLRDEADWEAVELMHARGEYLREVKFLYELAAEREEGIILGPNVSANMEEAAYRVGLIRLEYLDDPEGAIEDLENFLDVWVHSLLRDDAARWIVYASIEIGDRRHIRESARQFLRNHPESRFVDEIAAILEEYSGSGP